MFRLTESAGEDLEKAVIATIVRALADTNLVAQTSPNAEADLLAARGMELATRTSPFRPNMSTARKSYTQWQLYKQSEEQRKRNLENRNSAIATYERTLLRDPNNLEAKTMLGYSLLSDLEPARREHGKELLREVVASKDPKYADRAQRHLTQADMLARAGEEMFRPLKRPDDFRSLNQAYEENPSDLEAKYDLGAAVLKLGDRQRDRKMLTEVAAGDRQDLADRARKLLAELEKYPAIADAATTPTSAAKPIAPEPSANPPRTETLEPEDATQRARREFLQKQFAKFIPPKFEKDGPQLAVFQQVPVKESMFDYEGRHYCGFRFTTPSWLDGDLQWMHILAKTEALKDFRTETLEWGILMSPITSNCHSDFPTPNLSFTTVCQRRVCSPARRMPSGLGLRKPTSPT